MIYYASLKHIAVKVKKMSYFMRRVENLEKSQTLNFVPKALYFVGMQKSKLESIKNIS